MTEEDFKRILDDALHSRMNITNDLHATHHKFVEMCMEREERKREMWEKIKAQVGGWAIIGVLGAIGTAVYNLFIQRGH